MAGDKVGPDGFEIRHEFAVHMLNETGRAKARDIAKAFTILLCELELHSAGGDARSMAIAKTKLEEACCFAKRAMASSLLNQE